MAVKEIKYVEKYGLKWPAYHDPVELELYMIRHGGEWQHKTRGKVGNGLFYHYKALQQLLWPEEDWHRWRELTLKSFLEHRVIGVLGPGSSGKTHDAALFALCTYYAFPDCCTALCCSTEREMLEKRIWGEIKMHHKKARSAYEWIPGHLTESKQIIMTDARFGDVDGRDFRNGLCFPVGTLVDTPNGPIPIESVRVGQTVFNAVGTGIVTGLHRNHAPIIARVSLSDGRHVDCTPDHPFLTNRGWIKAVELETSDTVFSPDETLQIMRENHSEQRDLLLSEVQHQKDVPLLRKHNWTRLSQQDVLFGTVSPKNPGEEMQSMRKEVPWMEAKGLVVWKNNGQVLQPSMCWEMGVCSQNSKLEVDSEMQELREVNQGGASQSPVLFGRMQASEEVDAMRKVQSNVLVEKGKTKAAAIKILQQDMSDGRSRTNIGVEEVSSFGARAQGVREVVGHRFPSNSVGRGNRRTLPQWPTKEGCPKGQNTKGTRVDGVAILESRSDPRTNAGGADYTVYNLEVDGHPSYSVNDVIVHNCGVPCKKGGNYVGLSSYVGVKNKIVILVADEGQFLPRAFVDAIANLNKNQDSRGIPKALAGLKVLVLGNPKDTTDSLGIVCEPSADLGGWDGGIDQSGKTKTWSTRFDGGICVQLVGSDCPNMDVPEDVEPPFPYLITRKAIQQDIQFYGQESLQFTMMDEGRMPRGLGTRRVITRQMCLRFGAMEPPVWKDSTRTKIAFADIAYGALGGDRCVFGELDFGIDVNNQHIMALIDTMLVPISVNEPDIPEDQIAKFVSSQCSIRNIPPENFFFDSTGRGSFIQAISRIWSPNVQGVEFGGKPSDRIVSAEIKSKCSDYYKDRVSELWFNTRLVIMASQFRGMTEDMMQEGCCREWKLVGANKTEVEEKKETKLKVGRSPDLYDGLAVGCEGARQRGFIIANVSNKAVSNKARSDWLERKQLQLRRLRENHQLTYR